MFHQRLIDRLTEFYKNFLPEFFQKAVPEETASTCSDCAMWVEPGEGTSSSIQFSRETKCCTFYPNLPNYLVGALLSQEETYLKKGKERVDKLIYSRVGITPLGIRRSRKYELLVRKARSAFGKTQSMVCPFFEQKEGLCTIYPFWNGTCSTWFCKYNAGYDGQAFWLALRNYIRRLEKVLAQYAAHKNGFEARYIIMPKTDTEPWTERTLDDLPVDDVTYKKTWQRWSGRERDFFKETYERIKGLSKDDFRYIGGITQDILLKDLEKKRRKLIHPLLPKRLKYNQNLIVEKTREGEYILSGYSSYDPIKVSKRIYNMLDFFDGYRSNEDAFGLIFEHVGIEPSKDLLLKLYQFRILTQVGNKIL